MKKIKIIIVALFAMSQIINGQIITTIAGDSVAGYNNDGILAINAELNSPQAVAIDKSGNIYIADFLNSRIRKITVNTGIISTIAGTGTAGYNGDGIAAVNAELNFPLGITIDDSGNVYIADAQNNRIRKITISTDNISTIAGTGTAGFNNDGIQAITAELHYPCAIALDSSGNVYVADKFNNRIRKITISTGLISTITGTGVGVYNGDGIIADTATISIPTGLTIDGIGNVYISDNGNQRIRKITNSTGFISTVCGTGTPGFNGDGIATVSELNGPAQLNIDIDGNLYLADEGNNRIRKITVSSGNINTIAGTGISGYYGEGITPTFAELKGPTGVTLDTTGNVYIADAGNNRIRKITMNTGIGEINNSLSTILVYPNPNDGNFNFSFSLSSKNSTLQIMELTGRVVYTHNIYSMEGKETINVSNLNNGIYFYTIANDKEFLKGKFIKQ